MNTIKCKACGVDTTNIKYCSNECSWKSKIKYNVKIKNGKFVRDCPSCKCEVFHTAKQSCINQIRHKVQCKSCARLKFNKSGDGKLLYKRISMMMIGKNNPFWEKCGKENNMYKPGVLDRYIKKYGYDNYYDFLASKTDKQIYKKNVLRITNSQSVHLLPNSGKRGRLGYHLDHIVPINYGFVNNIPVEYIGDISNLQFITYSENVRKHIKLFFESKDVHCGSELKGDHAVLSTMFFKYFLNREVV